MSPKVLKRRSTDKILQSTIEVSFVQMAMMPLRSHIFLEISNLGRRTMVQVLQFAHYLPLNELKTAFVLSTSRQDTAEV